MGALLWIITFVLLSTEKAFSKPNLHDPAPPRLPKGELHALLIAGSVYWSNYRHQADVAHAYKLLLRKGVKAENVVVMMFDDIAHHPMNPYPGKLFNRPHGEDVYEGIKIDYKGWTVNSTNFLNVLQGNANKVHGGNGRVINSKSDDRIFVYFTDHGGDGLIGFPKDDDVVTKKQLYDALQEMHKNKKYSQLVIYLEACESGSMFDGILTSDINVYAVTAANTWEPSFGEFCNNDMNLPCLADEFSLNWMEDSEKHDLDMENLETQYEDVKALTTGSTVSRYGNLNLTDEPVVWFEGDHMEKKTTTTFMKLNVNDKGHSKSLWPARDIELMYLQNELKKKPVDSLEAKNLKQKIAEIYENRRHVEALFLNLATDLMPNANDKKDVFDKRNSVKDLTCHHEVVKTFLSTCRNVNKFGYAFKYIYVLNNLCVKMGDSKKIIDSIHTICSTASNQ
ncbi:peptidase C13 family protein [Dictyocaulus viviparus]|uniref:legumain n=1 Tax=Dictyocaulus viviparus TaxID=29172 RepID=I6QM92_DICVI|nr:legumain 2 [Dictyocaulus viviparus]KJH49309.1 peptidase C13 family protein [Dictyocaulus viviparus]